MNRFQFTFILLLITNAVYPQETGRTFIRNFSASEYRASTQNWNIKQDKRDIMYFSNGDGLLEYDGIDWQLTRIPGTREIHISDDGRIYIAMENDIGYFEPDNKGNLQYYSLKKKIPETAREFSTVIQVSASGQKIVFLTNEKLFIYGNDTIKVIPSVSHFSNMIFVRDRLCIRQAGKGIFYLENDSLFFLEGSEFFADERMASIVPFHENELMVVACDKGIFIYSETASERLYKPAEFKEVDNFLDKNPAFCGILLPGGDIAVGTTTSGILVFNPEGKIRSLYNKNTGLQDDIVYNLFTDNNNQLWAALDNGISLIQNDLPFNIYNEQNGLNGQILCIYLFQNRLYAGTSQYMYFQNEKGNFEIIPGTTGQNFDLFESKGVLLSARNPGISEIKGEKAILMPGTDYISFICFSNLHNFPNYLLAGTGNGLYLLEYKNSSWKLGHKIKGFDQSVYSVAEDTLGNIWIFTMVELLKMTINSSFDSIISLEKCTSEQGLPQNFNFPVKLSSGEIVFTTDRGIFKYIEDKNMFEPHPDFRMLKGRINPFIQGKNGDIWFDEVLGDYIYEKGVLKLINGEYKLNKTPFLKLCDIGTLDIYPASDSAIFFGTSSGLLKYDPTINLNINNPYNTLIRKVYFKDSLVFGGAVLYYVDFENIKGPDIRYANNDVVFHFAATSYEDSEKNLYSYRLIGRDTSWSAWTNDHKKEFTNLHEGRYVFEVKSMTQYRTIGSTASYSFRILRPPYRTLWAFGIYTVLTVFFIWLIVRLNTRRILKQKEQLEKTVTERTAQLKNTLDIVNSQKTQIEAVNEQITDSIKYAKYIQSAILPSKESLDSHLKDYFILFKPRDIVSGDFYWSTSIENLLIITAADCTGHGVPGAFMSLLGAAFLNEIINKEYITHPGVILRRLRKEVIRSLHQRLESGELKDGMDLCLCTIDFKNMKLHFAGANNPLYIIRNKNEITPYYDKRIESDKFILYEIKGDHMPVAIHESMKDFTVHEIDLINGDILYLFTDGYADQFGGPGGKKLQYSNFRKILLDHAAESIEDQKINLENTFIEWQGNNSQVDDILVIGIKI